MQSVGALPPTREAQYYPSRNGLPLATTRSSGEVSEWLKELAWKASGRVTPASWVRIPPSPLSRSASRREERLEQRGGVLGQQPALDQRPVVDHRLGEQVDHTADRASLRVARAVDQARHPSQGDRAGAHRARLQGHVDRRI